MSSFDRLTPALQYQIVNTLGFQSLRPVQELSIDAILDGKNCVVLAPTAGGKTEAAFFPILSGIDAGDWKPVSVIYLSPIRALLNNQEDRIARYAQTIGRRVFKWHGDTTQRERKQFLAEPSDILLTTPESLEAMLMSARIPAGRLFAGLRAVVIDEIHAFAGEDRGAHLASILERLSRYCGQDVQRIGLSATVGNPEEIGRWVQGRSQRPSAVISPPKAHVAPQLTLDYVGSVENAAHVIATLHQGKKRLVFVDSRKRVEEVGRLLLGRRVDTYIIHGSLAQEDRREAEKAFAEKQDCVIVSTSALELGVDVGDLDHVIQIDAPGSVASFLQRMGRTGRRAGTTPNCLFLTTKDEATLQAAAIIHLHRNGYIEPVRPSRRAAHILAHQLMALTIQLDGVRRNEWFAWLEGATPFADLDAASRDSMTAHMLEQGILADHDGKLWLGDEGEKRYGRRNFEELYAVFSSPRIVTVMWGTREVGTIDVEFLEALKAKSAEPAFSLGGRPWAVREVDWRKGICYVDPASAANAPRWSGSPKFLSYPLCQAMRQVLVGDVIDPSWSKRAIESIASQRAEHKFPKDEPSPITSEADSLTWWTFAGGRANSLLARIIESELGGSCRVRNQSITATGTAADSAVALRSVVRELANTSRPDRADARRFAELCVGRQRLSKFQPCLTDTLLNEYFADAIDVDGAALAVMAGRTRGSG